MNGGGERKTLHFSQDEARKFEMADNHGTQSARSGSLRPEARPCEWKSLTESQRTIFQQLVALLNDALNQVEFNQSDAAKDCVTSSEFPDRLRQQTRRINPVIMVSGRRGTGKTSLLLTLQREIICAANEAFNPKDCDCKPPVDVSRLLAKLRTRIVWLETLDLEPLPESTGLMAAIMARIDQAITEESEKSNLTLSRPLSEFGKKLQDLNELCLDVCLAWDHDYPRIGGNTDTDMHSRELWRVEKARTNLQTRFVKVLNDLAKETPWIAQKKNPLFILPVDDIDLNPSRCLELLRLVRSFTTPRFVVLLFGDYDIAQSVVKLSFLKEFGQVLPKQVKTGDPLWESVEKHANRLGAEAIRKMLPPNQRFRIDPVSLSEVLKFSRGAAETKPLGELLGEIKIPFQLYDSMPELNLLMWIDREWPNKVSASNTDLQRPKDSDQSVTSPWPPSARPSAGLAFTTTLRKLADLQIGLEEYIQNENQESRLGQFIETLWIEFQRGLLEDGLNSQPDAEQEIDYTPTASLLRVHFHLKFAAPPERTVVMPFPEASLVRLQFPAEPRLVDNTTDPPTEILNVQSTSATLGRGVLLHDLIVLANTTTVNPISIPTIEQLELVRIDWKLDSVAEACTVVWPGPSLKTVWELELFLANWNRFRLHLPTDAKLSREEMRPVTNFWLAICGAFAFKSKTLWDVVKEMKVNSNNDQKDIIAIYANVSKDALSENMLSDVDDWLVRAAAFLGPENYIDDGIAKAFFRNRSLKDYWSLSRCQEGVQNLRRRSVSKPTSLFSIALLNPKDFHDAITLGLERAKDTAEGMFDAPNPFRQNALRSGESAESVTSSLVGALNEAIAGIHDNSVVTKQFTVAKSKLGELRRGVSRRTIAGAEVQKAISLIENTISTIEGTIPIFKLVEKSTVNTFGGFCPSLPIEDMTL